jgi:hypothetical protein
VDLGLVSVEEIVNDTTVLQSVNLQTGSSSSSP